MGLNVVHTNIVCAFKIHLKIPSTQPVGMKVIPTVA